jgi:hypothetical protein
MPLLLGEISLIGHASGQWMESDYSIGARQSTATFSFGRVRTLVAGQAYRCRSVTS